MHLNSDVFKITLWQLIDGYLLKITSVYDLDCVIIISSFYIGVEITMVIHI